MKELLQCGADRCLIYRSLGSVDLLRRCMLHRCAAFLRPAKEESAAGMEQSIETPSTCAAACQGLAGNKYLECLSQSCGVNPGSGTSAFCPSICHTISRDDVEGCLQRYCPANEDQDQDGELQQGHFTDQDEIS